MGFPLVLCLLNFASVVFAHGYIKWVGVDNKLWPGFNPHVDAAIKAKRISFGQSYSNHPRYAPDNVLRSDIACGSHNVPAGAQAPARAGSNITFGWSTWPITHNGPIMTYMGRYSGDVANVNVNEIEFFKIGELGLLPDNVTWATNVLTANDNVTSATIPHDIIPGNYIVRHELITLHFATEDSRYYDAAAKAKGAQHFITCFNIKVTGSGKVQPPGVKFPGGYKPRDPGIYFDLYRNITPYPIPGPPVYKPSGPAPVLEDKPYEIVMPVGNLVEDIKYFNNMYYQAWKWDGQTYKRNYDAIHGWEDGPNKNLTRACTAADPCLEDIGGSNPSYGL
ncbi:hypothetical protein EJ06DRAFT_520918 [Trichodelitschia bisporula]|uniref:lytic cellulose monooxygenase (C4-dehydrogenating) n=1 Tax=Trichodelitschia bisporula TaxID=703511 RepID=A0A6G1I1T8_9PEZI|nr:hypothetical protein EJ06DRAFT_520918 [Trichodelitschia bisporula]